MSSREALKVEGVRVMGVTGLTHPGSSCKWREGPQKPERAGDRLPGSLNVEFPCHRVCPRLHRRACFLSHWLSSNIIKVINLII